jgi:hypothetical protein
MANGQITKNACLAKKFIRRYDVDRCSVLGYSWEFYRIRWSSALALLSIYSLSTLDKWVVERPAALVVCTKIEIHYQH